MSIPCHADEIDASDLPVRVEAYEKAGRIAAREDELHQIKVLVCYRAALQNFGAPRRCPYKLTLRDICLTASSVSWALYASVNCARSNCPACISAYQRSTIVFTSS